MSKVTCAPPSQPELLCVWSAAAWVPPYSLPIHAPGADIYPWAAPWSGGEKERKKKGRESTIVNIPFGPREKSGGSALTWRQVPDIEARFGYKKWAEKVTFFWTQLCRDTSFSVCSRLPTSTLSWLLRSRRAEFSSVRTRACSDSWLNCAFTSIVSFMTDLTASGTLRFTKCSTSVRMDAARLSVSFSSLQTWKRSLYLPRTSQAKGFNKISIHIFHVGTGYNKKSSITHLTLSAIPTSPSPSIRQSPACGGQLDVPLPDLQAASPWSPSWASAAPCLSETPPDQKASRLH